MINYYFDLEIYQLKGVWLWDWGQTLIRLKERIKNDLYVKGQI